ncbi:tRNA (adenosine(37)-N6)-threonylcarbamoyltransferase complex dimerization subunit type 1 TsaB [Cyanobium gracile UHCC 0139]|uniref:tRNA (Adenosine(37)-N6)-threonylcarbamoyltransferase complex dimerization subunit type 1 TsaB n=1 Tax=Cyanobium gracile UHCC 0139 TaxID=3110308 RepID=A0ABU5RNG6_9CYAN|nr:tRNA (adenosine(37)-N6)-threonylcarbamoyltransferase complex dimerization subunit type 1 TsaB [Cyanobium gracile]MEA5389642.1 tRNA (adenosine(37)-N6)-threonylcarbamoyltransferase complex dimerization subunit type 1 TsaB [Cyanobium gracile UHCC 0139]
MSALPDPDGRRWLLALHSSSESLGVGLQRLGAAAPERLETFPLGRSLSNGLFECLESVLPASAWPRLGRLAVATGPGGFTGTRLTVVLARTLAQQLALPLDGISSFRLMARRLLTGSQPPGDGPFWLLQELPRRGVVAGLYGADPGQPGGIAELEAPRLHRDSGALAPYPILPALVQLPEDVIQLLGIGAANAAEGQDAPWQPVLPLYPTSPVEALPC